MKKTKRKAAPRSVTALDTYIGVRIRESRNTINMSQTDLGQKLGVTFQQIQKYERGRNRISAARLYEVCKILNVSLASMFERDLKA